MTSTADPWERLSQSAKASWRWAWAIAITRTAATKPSDAATDTVDLLGGLALTQIRDNPASQLLAHFHIPAAAILSDGRRRDYQAEELRLSFDRTPAAGLPPLNGDAAEVLEYALTTMPPGTDGQITLSILFAALLETPNAVSGEIRRHLNDRGVADDPVMRSCRDHLDSRTSYSAYLATHHPYQAPEIRLPRYLPDEPRARRPSNQPATEITDLVGIAAEVDAFAYLITSRALTPPLAIGVFGDWGSGKSYFLRSVQRRIDQLVSIEADQPPFYRAIAQVEFNAWQYVEGNLWASLLEHLFRNLRPASEDDDDLLETRRREYLTRITESTDEHRRAVKEREELTQQRQRAHQVVEARTRERDGKLTVLREAQRRNPFIDWRPSKELGRTLDEFCQRTGLAELSEDAVELQRTLAETGDALRQAGPLLGPLRAGGWRYALALIVVIGLGPLVSFLLSHLDVSAVSNVIGSGSAVLAGITAYAARGNTVLTSTLRMISQAEEQLRAEMDETRQKLDKSVQDATAELVNSERALEAAAISEQRIVAEVAELEKELARITPSSVLTEFVGNRFASDDYRQHLGVPALVRQDLERLSRLIQQRHDGDPADPPMIGERHAIDRVVLYIDDLDRCPTDVVIKVLQAVHLLLAFPLFVVVLAVDARWLESSLREHYTQLNTGAAEPSDYLGKIFQVPFWVRPLGADTRRRMVGGLLIPNLDLPTPPRTDDSSAAGTDDTGTDWAEFRRLVESFNSGGEARRPELEAARLTLSGRELDLIEDVCPLVGTTPREMKRFVNVYLLVKSIGQSRGWPLPEQGQIAALLAIATGLPDLAGESLPRVATAEAPTLASAFEDPAGDIAIAQSTLLTTWLEENPSWGELSLTGLNHWIDLILRFRFARIPPRP